MTMATDWPVSDLNAEFFPKASLAYDIGDLLYWSSGDSAVLPFSSLADLGTAALMQIAVARLFVGICNTKRQSTDTSTSVAVRALVDRIYEFPCESATFAIGDYVGASYNTSVLRTQQVAKVAGPHMAIGRVVKRYASATTKVKCRIMSRYLLGFRDEFSRAPVALGLGLTTLADQDNTLTVDLLTRYYEQTPTANPRKLILPAEAQCAGVELCITNLAAMTNGIQVRNSGDSATVLTTAAAKAGIVWCNGTSWRGLTG